MRDRAGVLLAAAGSAWLWIAPPATGQAPAEPRPAVQRANQPGAQPEAQPGRPEAQPGQPGADDERFDGRLVREVRLVQPNPDAAPGAPPLVPLDDATAMLARNQVRVTVGRPFRRRTMLDDISRLNRTARFGTIESFVQPLEDGSVVVTYQLKPQPVIVDMQSVGNRLLTDQELQAAVGKLAGTPVDRLRIERGATAIENLYRSKGYYLARVTVDEPVLAESRIVLYRVIEGERVRVMGLRFEGNNSFSPAELRGAIKTREADLLIEKGTLDDEVLGQDVVTLARFYNDRGYLDVRADRLIQPSPNGREAIVTFVIDEGPLYTLRSVKLGYKDADALDRYKREVLKDPASRLGWLTAEQMRQLDPARGRFTAEQLAGVLNVKTGDAYSRDKLGKGLRLVQQAFGELGYFDAAIDSRNVRDLERPEVDLYLFVEEGKAYKVGEIRVKGNDITSKDVIMRAVELRPEQPLSPAALDQTRRGLQNLRLFAPEEQDPAVTVTVLPPGDDPDRRDVLIEVHETNTGRFNIGAGVSSDGGAFGSISLTQRNFDVTDPPDSFGELVSGRAFRGAGQDFAIQLQPGDRVQQYSISLTEPRFLESDYSLGGRVGYLFRKFAEYDEERYGGSLRFGRRFGRRWTGTLSARFEWVTLSDIEADSPRDFFETQGKDHLTGLGVEVARTTVDDRYRPTQGSRIELAAERVGALGGDYSFTKLRAEHVLFLPIIESFEGSRTVLSLTTKVGYIPESSRDVPPFERYYLGGQTMRGFAYRTVSPRSVRNDTGGPSPDPVGGTWLFFWGPEIQQPVYEDVVSIVGFLDTGTVTNSPGFEDYRVGAGVGMRFYIRQLSPLPLAFDFGFPLRSESEDRQRVFTFSLDIPF